jgi:STE24 endopeptidase
MNEDRAARYQRLKRRGHVLSAAMGAALLVVVAASGVSIEIRNGAEALVAAAPEWLRSWMVVAAYVVALGLLHEILTLPLGLYFGYAIERRYELSVEPWRAWLRDHVKAVLVGGALSLTAAEIVYATVRRWPEGWWLVSAAILAAITLVLVTLTPVLLLPLFYRFKPIERETLRDRLMTLASRARVPALGVYEWGLGEKTRKANAALVGLGRTRRILVSDTLLSDYSEDEIEVILAHELAHHVYRDIWKGFALEAALIVAGFWLADRALTGLGPAIGTTGPADVAGLPILLLAGGVVSLCFGPLGNAISRRHERQADRYALTLTGQPDAFISAMRRLGAQNLAEERPSKIVQWLFHSHPTVGQRVEAARDFSRARQTAAVEPGTTSWRSEP